MEREIPILRDRREDYGIIRNILFTIAALCIIIKILGLVVSEHEPQRDIKIEISPALESLLSAKVINNNENDNQQAITGALKGVSNPGILQRRDSRLDLLCGVSFNLLRLVQGLQDELDSPNLDSLLFLLKNGRADVTARIIERIKNRLNLDLSMANVPEGTVIVDGNEFTQDVNRGLRSYLRSSVMGPRVMRVPQGVKDFLKDNKSISGLVDFIHKLKQNCSIRTLIGENDETLSNRNDKCVCSLF